jgi:COMPASS component SWD2
LDFSTNGETLITSSDDDSMVIYDCLEGKWVDLFCLKIWGYFLLLYGNVWLTDYISYVKVYIWFYIIYNF